MFNFLIERVVEMVAATDGNLLEGARGLLAMGDALRLRE